MNDLTRRRNFQRVIVCEKCGEVVYWTTGRIWMTKKRQRDYWFWTLLLAPTIVFAILFWATAVDQDWSKDPTDSWRSRSSWCPFCGAEGGFMHKTTAAWVPGTYKPWEKGFWITQERFEKLLANPGEADPGEGHLSIVRGGK